MAYRILVVEDSKPILRDIVRLLDETEYEIEIRSTYDGEAALHILETFHPDIIFIDIKMPIMDGLTLIQKARELYPEVKCVIISGYTDFSFTREALLLQVDDYVMKPVDIDQFYTLLQKLIRKIDKENIEKEERVLQKLLEEGYCEEGRALPERYILILIRVGVFEQYAAPLPREILQGIINLVMYNFNMRVVNTKFNGEKLIVCKLDDGMNESVKIPNEIILRKLQSRYNCVNIIYSEVLSDINQLSEQYNFLASRMRKKVVLDRGSIYTSEVSADERILYIKQKEEIDIFRKKIEAILKNNAVDDYRKEIKKCVAQWKEKQYTIAVIRKFLIVLLDAFFIVMGGKQEAIEEPGILADKILHNCIRYKDLEECLQAYCEIISDLRDDKAGISAQTIQELVGYMRANIYTNLSLQDLADYFDVSASYICRLFKVYYSDTPISYYNRIKIEKARELLHEFQNMKVKGIAEMLGFNDQYYFSKVFKQQYGVSPQMYKSQIHESKE